jgi:hypothetical protein
MHNEKTEKIFTDFMSKMGAGERDKLIVILFT